MCWVLAAAGELLNVACGVQFPDQGSNPGPLYWEHRVLATGSPGRSVVAAFLIFPMVKCREIKVLFFCLNTDNFLFHFLNYNISEVKSLGRVPLFAIPWTVARQAPLSMGFPRPEYQSGSPFPFPGDLPDSGI